MICTTIKNGVNCSFMTASGCSYGDGRCLTVAESCKGCERVATFPSGEYCVTYPNPAVKWEFGRCNFATHIERAKAATKKLNPLKASKRAAAGRG